jgi:hypothetical protein
MRAYQTSLRKTSRIVESSAFSEKGLISTVAFTRLKKNSMVALFLWPVKQSVLTAGTFGWLWPKLV